MTMKAITISKLASAVGVAAILALTSGTPSLATNSNDGGPFIIAPGGNASASSGFASASTQRAVDRPSAHRARAQVPHRNGKHPNVPAGNPPASAD